MSQGSATGYLGNINRKDIVYGEIIDERHYPNKRIMYRKQMIEINGIQHEMITTWHRQGYITSEGIYKDDIPIVQVIYYSDGREGCIKTRDNKGNLIVKNISRYNEEQFAGIKNSCAGYSFQMGGNLRVR